MDIRKGHFLVNKTWKFLRPALRSYGPMFKVKSDAVFKLAMGIHDCILDGTDFQGKRYLYILIDKTYRSKNYEGFMNWVKNQSYYITDYDVDDMMTGFQHMLVIKFPEDYASAYDYFLDSRYSLMYSREELEKFYDAESPIKDILNKTASARREFLVKLNKSFETTLEEIDLMHPKAEMDFPIEKAKEYFNYRGE